MRSGSRYAGVAAVVVLWASMLAATAVAGFDLLGERPLSYLGSQPGSALLFTVGLAVAAILLMVFHQHVRDRYRVSLGFSAVMLTGLAGQLVAAFVPIGGDATVHRIHTTSALVLGASLPVLMWRFAAAQPRGPWRRLSYVLFWAEAGACVAGLALSALHLAPVAEILPAAAFHAWVVALTFPRRGAVLRRADAHPVRAGRVTAAGHGVEAATSSTRPVAPSASRPPPARYDVCERLHNGTYFS